jgi:NADP-dependent 3-hydroxy-3-methylglutaryl-CoA reductase
MQASDTHVIDNITYNIVISVLGRNYHLAHLLLIDITPSDNRRSKNLVLKCQGDRETSSLLCQISFALRMHIRQQNQEVYTERTLPKVPGRGLYTDDARHERLAFVKEQTGRELEEVSSTRLQPNALVSNIEALLGSVEIPVGIAGPLHVKGEHANGLFYAPMATTEGALVASATRGATALSRCGGVTARVLGQRMLRVPVFVLEDLSMALFFAEWVKDHQSEIAEQTRRYSNYADLVDLQTQVLGRAVHVHFIYETGDAAGQNMTTTCTWQACQWIFQEMWRFDGLNFENFLVEANLSNDKKVTYQSFLKGRGIRVLAECVLTEEICTQVLKVTPRQLVDAYNQVVCGSIAAGMVGININIANVIAAIFTATGQDIACVHESAIGHLHMELIELDAADEFARKPRQRIYATLMLPSLVVGTVGGGTNLPQQKECLQLLGCAGADKAHKLAEIISGFCLALDISTLSAIASDQFARAHEKLGRNRPVDWLRLADLNEAFFNAGLRQSNFFSAITVERAELRQLAMTGSSIITELTSHKINKLVGHFPFRLHCGENCAPVDVMVKVKPLDDEVILMLNSMAGMCDARLAQLYNQFKDSIGFKGCHVRELAVMSQPDERFRRHAPLTYFTVNDAKREAYVIVQEYLQGLELMDSADDTRHWTSDHLKAALQGIAEVHAIWLNREQELCQQPWLGDVMDRASMHEKKPLWEMLAIHAQEEFPEWFDEQDKNTFKKILHSLDQWYEEIDAMPKTLIHNDFNPRNIAFRRHSGKLTLCAYDWELATLHLPQHDCAELLIFALNDDADQRQVDYLVDYHRRALEKAAGVALDPEQWRRGYELCLYDLLVNRVSMYLLAHTFRHYGFMARVQRTLRHLLELEATRVMEMPT